MAILNAICTSCNERISVDDTKEAIICPRCNQPIITEKAIKLYDCKTYGTDLSAETPNKTKAKSGKAKRVLWSIGKHILFFLDCIWTLVCTIILVDVFVDLTSKKK